MLQFKSGKWSLNLKFEISSYKTSMKINKRGSQSTGSTQHLLFNSRKNSLKEPISMSALQASSHLQESAMQYN